MKFFRHFTTTTPSIADQIKWKTAESKITKSNGEIVFHMTDIEVPDHWTQGPINILAQKYLRKMGISTRIQKIEENNIPKWLCPSVPFDDYTDDLIGETSAKQVFHRLAGAWAYWGWKEGIFHKNESNLTSTKLSEESAKIFYDEIYYMLAHQFAAPNSPQFFNTGLNWAYGIKGDESGQWMVNDAGEVCEAKDSYTNPQPHACFIQPISDNLVESGGIFDLLRKEALLFKHGSGTGTNFSNIRSKYETLSGGGKSSGLISFLTLFDSAAGAIQSGGTTRRAAKMICLDLDHPEIEEFIDWKMNEEAKAAALYVGNQILNHHTNQMIGDYNNYYNLIPQAMLDRAAKGIGIPDCDLGFEGEAMNTVSGQNANNSIRIIDEFLQSVDANSNWPFITRNGKNIIRVVQAKNLWQKICTAAWACADPGLQFHDTINLWHTCKNDGRINASNPCSEYMFLDNTACNLASLNLGKFLINNEFDIKSFIHAARIWTTVLEISVYMASFPSKEIAHNSYLYRTLGLGYCNAGGVLMRQGISYDSDKGRDYIASITALMHGIAYLTSHRMALELGPFNRWKDNSESMSDVILKHKNHLKLDSPIWIKANYIWSKIDGTSEFRNAQVTLIAPTGTIALLMDSGDFTGIEPSFSLVQYKQLAGGGGMKIVNNCVPDALKSLGYTPAQIMSISQHITEHDTIEGWVINGESMPEEHLSVFDCAVPGGITGTRSLCPMAHVKMVAAVQPFLSGAVSKTVNMPNSATIADVDHIYRESHRLGLKAVALYRDGSKLTQPLNSKQEKKEKIEQNTAPNLLNRGTEQFICHEPIVKNKKEPLPQGKRQRLPPRTTGYRQKFSIDGQSIYLHTGEYLDGRLGEVFIEFSREGSLVRALTNSIGKVVSIGLQYGVPLSEFVDAFVFTKFEPSGLVHGHDKIKLCSSPLDLIFKDLAIHYLHMTEFSNTNPQPNGLDHSANTPESNITDNSITSDTIMFSGDYPIASPTHTPAYDSMIAVGPKPLTTILLRHSDACTNCGHYPTLRTGTCITCPNCGVNSGCG